MEPIRIDPKTKEVWHRDPISGHEWSTTENLKGYEVSGGCWPWGAPFLTTSHKTLKSAASEADLRESIQQKRTVDRM